MTDAKPLIAGNWKMNGLRAEAVALAEAAAAAAAASDACEVAVFPPFTALDAVAGALAGSPVALGGQDCHEAEAGAHTSCISAAMLADLGCRYVILGHSERRHGRRETSETVRDKARAAFRAGLTPIVCVGETRAQRIRGLGDEAVVDQVFGSVPHAEGPMMLAYEPVWAIGTGKTATVEEIAGMHDILGGVLEALERDCEGSPILYGGSVTPDNAAEILAVEGVGGLLVGGASLDAQAFGEIIRAAG